MEKELQSKLVEILSSVQSATKAAGDFALEQLPDIAQSYVLYGRVFSLVTIVICLLVLLALVWVFRVTLKATRAGTVDDVVWVPGGIVGAIVSVVTVVILLESLQSAILVWVAPKVWLIRELASLIK